MKNEGITELHFSVVDNKSVHPGRKDATRVVVKPDEDITIELTEEEESYLRRTGHIGGMPAA